MKVVKCVKQKVPQHVCVENDNFSLPLGEKNLLVSYFDVDLLSMISSS